MKNHKVLIINGPNLNLLGDREPEIYGMDSLSEIKRYTEDHLQRFSCKIDWFQSNLEGEIINYIQKVNSGGYDLLVINPAGYTHTSVAILDALKMVKIPVIEVHLTNTNGRESFRKEKVTTAAATSVIEGFGKDSYYLAVYSYFFKEEEK